MIKILLFFLFTITLYAINYGHRLGGDLFKPENSLYSYHKLMNLKNKKNFKYIEFDIQETKDSKLVLFHDINSIARVVPKNTYNIKVLHNILRKKTFKQIKISDLKFKTLNKLRLKHNAKIITLDKILAIMAKENVKKAIHIEIKRLSTDLARNNLIKFLKNYSTKLDIVLIGFKKHLDNSFPYFQRWLTELKKINIKVLVIDMNHYDITKSIKLTKSRYKVILEKKFSIDSNKSIDFNFNIIKQSNSNRLLIGLRHGYDDVGDKGLFFKVEDNKSCLYRGFSDKKGWEWFYLNNIEGSFNLKLIDKDTNGNKGSIKILEENE